MTSRLALLLTAGTLFLGACSPKNSTPDPAGAVGAASKDRGGGDDVGLEFQTSYNQALADLATLPPEQIKAVDFAKLALFFKSVAVIVVDDPLVVVVNDVTQHSVAVNDKSLSRILINRLRWQEMADPHEREALSLHEVFSLMSLEDTGQYTYSSLLLTKLGDNIAPPLLDVGATCVASTKCRAKEPVCIFLPTDDPTSRFDIYNLDVVWKVSEVCTSRYGTSGTFDKMDPETVNDFVDNPKGVGKNACEGALAELDYKSQACTP